MRRYKVEMTVTVLVRADDEEHAIGEALENVHDGSIRVLTVEEYDGIRPAKDNLLLNVR